MQYNEFFRWTVITVLMLGIGACGGGGGGGAANPLQGDGVAGSGNESGDASGGSKIEIAITKPASADTMETTDESVILEGTASSQSGIVSITWASDRGGEGTASGTSAWKTGGIPLEPGDNRITVTAEDQSGQTASLTVVIKRENGRTGSVTLSWTAPTHREDGTPLDDLAGYNIYYGRMSEVYDYQIVIDNPGITTYVVEDLKPGAWYFVVSAFDSNGTESNFSNEVKRIVE